MIVYSVLGVALLLSLAGMAARWWLDSQPGRDAIRNMVERYTSTSPQARIRISGLKPGLPWLLEVDQLTVDDTDGTWFSAREVRLLLDPWALASRTLRLREMRAGQTILARLPHPAPPTEDDLRLDEPPLETHAASRISIARLPLGMRLRIQRLDAPRVVLGDALDPHGGLLGEGRVAVVAMRGNADLRHGDGSALFEANGIEGSPDRLMIHAALKRGGVDMSFSLLADGPPGGVLATLGRLPPGSGLVAHMQGDGPLADWHGEYIAAVGELGSTKGRVSLSRDSVLRKAEVRGYVLPQGRHVAPWAASLLGQSASYSFRAIRKGNGPFSLDGSEVMADGLRVRLDGRVDPSKENLDVMLHADFPMLPNQAREAGLVVEAAEPVNIHLRGPWLEPQATVDAKVQRLRMDAWSGSQISANLDVSPLSPGNGLQISASLAMDELRKDGAMVLSAMTAKLAASSPDMRRVTLRELRLDSRELAVNGSGRASLAAKTAAGTFELHAADLYSLAPLTGLPAKGRLDVSVNLAAGNQSPTAGNTQAQPQTQTQAQTVEGSARVSATQLSNLPPVIQELLGSQADISAGIRVDNRTLRVNGLTVSSGNLSWSGHGQADLQGRTLSAEGSGALPRIGPLLSLAGVKAQGRMDLTASTSGKWNDLRLEARGKSPDLLLWDRPLHGASVSLHAAKLPGAPAGELVLEGITTGGPALVNVPFALDKQRQRLSVARARVEIPGAQLQASLEGDLKTRLVAGSVQGSIVSATAVGSLADLQARGNGSFEATLRQEGTKQAADARFNVADFELNGIHAASLTAKISATDLFGTPRGQAEVLLRDAARGKLRLDQATVRAASQEHGYTTQLHVQGAYGQPVTLDGTGFVTPQAGGWQARLSQLAGKLGRTPLALEDVATLSKEGNGYRLSPLALRMGQAQLTAQGAISPRQAQGTATVANLPVMRVLPQGLEARSGRVDMTIQLSGSGLEPQVETTFAARDVRLATAKGEAPPVHANGQARYAPGRPGVLSAQAVIRGIGKDDANVHVSLPAFVQLTPLDASLPAGPIAGSIRASLDLPAVEPFLDLNSAQFISGTALTDLQLSGTVSDPVFSGQVSIDSGRFEDVVSGTVIADIKASLHGDGRRIILDSLTATDGASGRLVANGDLTFQPEGNLAYALKVEAQQAVLVRRQRFTGSTSGSATFAGNQAGATLTGALTLLRAELNVPDRLPPSLTEVNATWVNVPAEFKPRQRLATPRIPWIVGLDIKLDIPGRFVVRAKGLDAEYQGNLTIGGDTQNTIIRGHMELVRGHLNFLDIPFSLKESELNFDGSSTPQLQLLAETRKNDILAQVKLRGPLDAPRVELTSDPALPQDEVLSRLLFGRAVNNLTPVQAIMLASAVQQLTGTGGGLDITGKVRGALGLDDLNVKGAANGEGYTVQAGKYLTDGVFLRIEKGITSEDDLVRLELEVTPSITLESQVGRQQGAGLGLFYKKDY